MVCRFFFFQFPSLFAAKLSNIRTLGMNLRDLVRRPNWRESLCGAKRPFEFIHETSLAQRDANGRSSTPSSANLISPTWTTSSLCKLELNEVNWTMFAQILNSLFVLQLEELTLISDLLIACLFGNWFRSWCNRRALSTTPARRRTRRTRASRTRAPPLRWPIWMWPQV